MGHLIVGIWALTLVMTVAEAVVVLLEASTVRRHGVPAKGTLVDTRYRRTPPWRGRLLPVIELTTQEGRTVLGSPRTGGSVDPRIPTPPRTVDVVYDRRDPTRIITPLNGSTGRWAWLPLLGTVVVVPVALWFLGRTGVVPGLPTVDLPVSVSPGVAVTGFLGVMFGVLGPFAVLASKRERAEEKRILTTGHRVPGILIDVRLLDVGEDSLRVPVIRFRTVDGVEMTSWPNGGTSRWRFVPGRQVTLVYDPQDPRRIYTDVNGSMGGTAWIGSLVGGIFTLIGMGLLVGLTIYLLGLSSR